MKIKVFILSLLVALIAVSCGKDVVPKPEDLTPKEKPTDSIPVIDTTAVDKLVLQHFQVANALLQVDALNYAFIFPGSILTVDSALTKLTVAHTTAYTALPVIYYSSNPQLPIDTVIPSLRTMHTYLKPVNTSSAPVNTASFKFSSWSEFVDTRILVNSQAENDDLQQLLKLFPLNEGRTTAPKSTTRLICEAENIAFDVAMDHVIGMDELISKEDLERLSLGNKTPYFVVGTYFGYHYKIIAESKKTAAEMKAVLNKFFDKIQLTASEIQILDAITLYIYLRTSATKESFIKKEKGANNIASLVTDFESELAKSSYVYPLSFMLFNLKDFSTFKHTYTNHWYTRVK